MNKVFCEHEVKVFHYDLTDSSFTDLFLELENSKNNDEPQKNVAEADHLLLRMSGSGMSL